MCRGWWKKVPLQIHGFEILFAYENIWLFNGFVFLFTSSFPSR